MPQLTPLNFCIEGKDGTKFEYTASVYVTADGEFRVNLDERLVEIARKMSGGKHGVSIDCARKVWKIQGKALDSIKRYIHECAQDHLNCETVTTRIIVYGHKTQVSVWKDGANLYPNGAGGKNGQWVQFKNKHNILNSNEHLDFFSVGLAAVVFDKTVYKRKTGDNVVYERVRGEEEGSPVAQLNSFCRLALDPSQSDCSEMPYTDEAALFFYNAMLSLCRLAINIDEFFGNPKHLESAIQEGRFLPTPTTLQIGGGS